MYLTIIQKYKTILIKYVVINTKKVYLVHNTAPELACLFIKWMK